MRCSKLCLPRKSDGNQNTPNFLSGGGKQQKVATQTRKTQNWRDNMILLGLVSFSLSHFNKNGSEFFNKILRFCTHFLLGKDLPPHAQSGDFFGGSDETSRCEENFRWRCFFTLLLMEDILHQLIGSSSHYFQGFIHPRWCRISAINSINHFSCKNTRHTCIRSMG